MNYCTRLDENLNNFWIGFFLDLAIVNLVEDNEMPRANQIYIMVICRRETYKFRKFMFE